MYEFFIDSVVRRFLKPFSSKGLFKEIEKTGLPITYQNVIDYLNTSTCIFPLEEDFFISRAGVFTRVPFCIELSRMELEKKILLVGHKCVPFVDPEIVSSEIEFFYNGKKIPSLKKEFYTHDVLPFFSLFGDEYAIQYMIADPACEVTLDDIVEKDLPQKVTLTVLDISEILELANFKKGDFFYASVSDWDDCVVNLTVVNQNRTNLFEIQPIDIEREKWYDNFEEKILESFEKFGPGKSIEEQFAAVFVYNRDLFKTNYGTLEKFLTRTKKVSFESYGVESRLWYKDQDIPVIKETICVSKNVKDFPEKDSNNYFPFSSTETVFLQAWFMDGLYTGNVSEEIVLKNTFPNFDMFEKKLKKNLVQAIKQMKLQLENEYNSFADREVGEVRHRFLEFYKEIMDFAYLIETSKIDFYKFPQNPLVILSQLLLHGRFAIGSIIFPNFVKKDTLINLERTFEGMKMNFEEIKRELALALKKLEKDKFFIIE